MAKRKSSRGKMSRGRLYLSISCTLLVIIVSLLTFYFLMPMTTSHENVYVYIDNDDTIDSVFVKLEKVSHSYSMASFKILSRHFDYDKKVRHGRYEIEPSMNPIRVFRMLRNGSQKPVEVVMKPERTLDRICQDVCRGMKMKPQELLGAMHDEDFMESLGTDTSNVQVLLIPDTYECYWDITPKEFLHKMKKQSDKFWTDERKSKADALNLTPQQVVTVASIVDEETNNEKEMPDVAGMYLNRLEKGMKLQADPTVKYALKQFDLKRITEKQTSCNSPYNTYRVQGLPPGPISIPSVVAIDAVLNRSHHQYMYMCAKEDFSGSHNFAVTYEEHLKNRDKYTEALNARGIK